MSIRSSSQRCSEWRGGIWFLWIKKKKFWRVTMTQAHKSIMGLYRPAHFPYLTVNRVWSEEKTSDNRCATNPCMISRSTSHSNSNTVTKPTTAKPSTMGSDMVWSESKITATMTQFSHAKRRRAEKNNKKKVKRWSLATTPLNNKISRMRRVASCAATKLFCGRVDNRINIVLDNNEQRPDRSRRRSRTVWTAVTVAHAAVTTVIAFTVFGTEHWRRRDGAWRAKTDS